MTNLLAERGKRYGEFEDQAKYVQAIKELYHTSPNWAKMEDDQKEALDMIANKLGRILNGDPNYDDNWADIAGYSKLVADRLQRDAKRDQTEAIEEFNRKANEYLEESLRQGGRFQTGPYQNTPSTPMAGVVGSEVLGVHPERTESEVDEVAPKVRRNGKRKASIPWGL